MSEVQTLKYRFSGEPLNLGDTIQAIALSRLIGPSREIYRDQADKADPDRLFLVNGWLGEPSVPANGRNTLFAGIHVGAHHEKQLAWIRQSRFPVGARDPFTQKMLAREGIASEMVGCATTTLEGRAGNREGRYAIDVQETETIALEQSVSKMTWPEQLFLAEARLQTLLSAEIVYTSRLYVALPCLAFGTPVVLRPSPYLAERFTLWDALGAAYNQPVTLDVSAAADRYQAFLRRGLEMAGNLASGISSGWWEQGG